MSGIDQLKISAGEKRMMKLPGSEIAQEIYLPVATIAAIDKYGMEIVECIEKNGMKFLLTSLTINENNPHLYPECLFYVLKDGVLFPRLAYRSKSTMKWRVCPKKVDNGEGHMLYDKGNYSYTTETIPFNQLSLCLEKFLVKGAKFTVEDIIIESDPEIDTYDKEVEPDTLPESLKHLVNFDPNVAFLSTKEEYDYFSNALKPENTPDGFVPDFSKPCLSSEKRYSELFGDFTVEKYRVNYNGIDFDFHMASDKFMGRIWIDKLERADDDGQFVNSYGISKKINGFKAHCLKPIEYVRQCSALNSNIDFDSKDGLILESDESKPFEVIVISDNYGDISEFLEKNKIIASYRRVKNIRRRSQEEIREEWANEFKKKKSVERNRKIFRGLLFGIPSLALIALLAKHCEEEKTEPVSKHKSEVIVKGRKDVKLKFEDLVKLSEVAEETVLPSVDVVNEIRECVEDSGEYNCFSSPFSSTRCYSETGSFPVTISSPGMLYDNDGNRVENGVSVSVGPGAFSEVFDAKNEVDDACDYALDLLDENIGIRDLDMDFYSDRAFGFWENAPILMPSLKIQNYKLFNDISENYEINDMGGDVFSVNIGDWETIIYSDISGSRDEFLEDTYSTKFRVRNPRGIYKVFDDPQLVLDYLDEMSGLQE